MSTQHLLLLRWKYKFMRDLSHALSRSQTATLTLSTRRPSATDALAMID